MQDEAGHFDRAFGDRVRRAREDRKWSQRKLAEELDNVGIKLDPSAVTRIERGSREAKLREAAAIAKVLQVPLEDLADSSNPRKLFESILESASGRSQVARNALADMAGLYLRAVHILDHDPGVIREYIVAGGGKPESYGEPAARETMWAALVLAMESGVAGAAPLITGLTSSEVESLDKLIQASVRNIVATGSSPDDESDA